MREKLQDGATVVLVLCAMVVTGFVVRSEVTGTAAAPAPELVPIDGWGAVAEGGHAFGPREAPVVLVEYSDFQCPFCAALQPTLRELEERFGDDLVIVFRHFPIEAIHPHARRAALAAECAGEQDRFRPYHDLLFTRQDEIGSVAWRDLAVEAAVPDLERFSRCLADEAYAERVDADRDSGARIGVSGTPTLVLNGMRVEGEMSLERLSSDIAGLR